MRLIETITSDLLPTSFVMGPIKYATETGNGEAKLYLRRNRGYTSEANYRSFFNDYNCNNVYRFVKRNLINYMNSDIVYNEYNNNCELYRSADVHYWREKLNEIHNLDDYTYFDLESRWDDSQSRYYIRSSEYIFRDIFRSISLPKLTYLSISKYLDECSENYIYNFELNLA